MYDNEVFFHWQNFIWVFVLHLRSPVFTLYAKYNKTVLLSPETYQVSRQKNVAAPEQEYEQKTINNNNELFEKQSIHQSLSGKTSSIKLTLPK